MQDYPDHMKEYVQALKEWESLTEEQRDAKIRAEKAWFDDLIAELRREDDSQPQK